MQIPAATGLGAQWLRCLESKLNMHVECVEELVKPRDNLKIVADEEYALAA